MTVEALLILLLVGAVAGWLAGMVMGGGFGLIGNIIVGVLGAVIASYLLPRVGVSINLGGSIINQIVSAFIGAIVLLLVVGIVRR